MDRFNDVEFYCLCFLREIEKENKLSESTLKLKSRQLDQFKKWLIFNKINSFNNLTEEDIINYKLFLKTKNSSESYQRNYLTVVKQLLSFLKKKKVNCPPSEIANLKELNETDVQLLVNYYFKTKGILLADKNDNFKKNKIIFSRHVKPAKDLLELSGSLKRAEENIEIISLWAKSRNLDYTIETVIKKWFELESLKPKKKEPKPYYKGDKMVFNNNKWYVIDRDGEWFEFADDKNQIDWIEE